MATPAKFVGDFRSAVTAMIDAFNNASNLVQFYQSLGWDQSHFDAALPDNGGELSAAEFVQAIGVVGTLAQTFGSEASVLAKLKQ